MWQLQGFPGCVWKAEAENHPESTPEPGVSSPCGQAVHPLNLPSVYNILETFIGLCVLHSLISQQHCTLQNCICLCENTSGCENIHFVKIGGVCKMHLLAGVRKDMLKMFSLSFAGS